MAGIDLGNLDWTNFTPQPVSPAVVTSPTMKTKKKGKGKGKATAPATPATPATPAADPNLPGTQDWTSFFQENYPGYGEQQAYQFPAELENASQLMTGMAETGRPTTYGDWYQNMKGVVETDIMDAIKEASEQAGLTGTRWSTPLGRTAQDIAGRRMSELGTQWAGMEAGAQENAMNRALSAMGQLPGIAQMRQEMPMNYATGLYNMGGGMEQSYQDMLAPLYQEYMRTLPENSPWMNYAMQLSSISPTGGGGSTMYPQMYQPSGLSQIFGGLASILPFLGALAGAAGAIPPILTTPCGEWDGEVSHAILRWPGRPRRLNANVRRDAGV